MTVEVHPLIARDVFATYGYFVIDSDTGCGVLVDPGAQPQRFLKTAQTHGWSIRAILLTHGHFDHTGAVNALRTSWEIPVYAHASSDAYLLDAVLNLSAGYGRDVVVEGALRFNDRDVIEVAPGSQAMLHVLHTPGHTDDSCVLYCPQAGIALVGDTVYEGGPGLTVFPTGNAQTLEKSLRSKVLTLPDDTQLLSGHSRPMTVADLRACLDRSPR